MVVTEMADLIVEFTRKKSVLGGRQKFRFRIKSGGNGRVLAVSNDAYVNEEDMENAVDLIIGPFTGREIIFRHLY